VEKKRPETPEEEKVQTQRSKETSEMVYNTAMAKSVHIPVV
jgi:hypothetical protein